jgi:hypothetical protein
VPFGSLLRHRADTFAKGEARDGYGQPTVALSPKLAAEPCRLTAVNLRSQGKLRMSLSRDVVLASHRLYFGAGADISEADTIDVKTASGQVLATGLNVLLVRKVYNGSGSVHHLEVDCREVRAPESLQ